MDEQVATDTESESAGNRPEEQQAREREALRRRVRESLLRCPGAVFAAGLDAGTRCARSLAPSGRCSFDGVFAATAEGESPTRYKTGCTFT